MALIHQKAVERIAVLPDSNLFRPPYTHKYTYLYRTTNEVNDKYYIGIHGTDLNPLIGWDGYLGSGTVLNRAIEKHGTENFVHKPLAIFGDREFAFLMERQYISKCIDDPMCYNIAPGGEGGLGWNESLKLWERRDPDAYYAHMRETPIKVTAAVTKAWADPERRKLQSEFMKEINQDPEYRKHKSEYMVNKYKDPKEREKTSRATKAAFDANPGLCTRNPATERELRYSLKRAISSINRLEIASKHSEHMKRAQLNRRRLEELLNLKQTPFTHRDLIGR